MKRRIIQIDSDKCNGCGACARACHEGAISMVDGKAKLMRDDYCDGLGDCLPACPCGAITFTEREAAAYDEAAVLENKKNKDSGFSLKFDPETVRKAYNKINDPSRWKTDKEISEKMQATEETLPCGCPGTNSKKIERDECECGSAKITESISRLSQWPVQIKLVPVKAPYFEGAKLLIAADCTAYAYAAFHERFIKGHITLVGCPKLDDIDYSEKLTQIISENDIKSVTIVRMEVPCCGGLEHAAKCALQNSGKFIPWQVVTISIDGNILE